MKYIKKFENDVNDDVVIHIVYSLFHDNYKDFTKSVKSGNIDINIQNEKGETPLILMCKLNMPTQRGLECIELLIKLGADMKIRDNNGKIFLDYIGDYGLKGLNHDLPEYMNVYKYNL